MHSLTTAVLTAILQVTNSFSFSSKSILVIIIGIPDDGGYIVSSVTKIFPLIARGYNNLYRKGTWREIVCYEVMQVVNNCQGLSDEREQLINSIKCL